MTGQAGSPDELLREVEKLRVRIAELEAMSHVERKAAGQALLQGQEVLWQVLLANDRERRLIAYEIHDGLAQALEEAITQLDDSTRLHKEGKAEAAEAFSRGLALVRGALAETRRLIADLRSPSPETPRPANGRA